MKLLLFTLFALVGRQNSLSPGNGDSNLVAITSTAHIVNDTIRKAEVTLEENVAVSPMSILLIKDTADTMADISRLLGNDYGELFSFIYQNGLKPRRTMAFYYSGRLPFIMEVAVEVDKFPNQTRGRVKINKVSGGNAIIAHFRGPYEQVNLAYTAISNWLQQQNKSAGGPPFEVYLNDPSTVNSPFDLRTDVYQLIK